MFCQPDPVFVCLFLASTCLGAEANRLSNARLPAGARKCHPVWESCFAAERPGGFASVSRPHSQEVVH